MDKDCSIKVPDYNWMLF